LKIEEGQEIRGDSMGEKEEKELKERVCRNAILAAYKLTAEKCNGVGGKFVEVYPDVFVWIPNPVVKAKEAEGLTCEERVRAVAESEWAMHEAKGLAEKLFGLKPGTPEYEEAVKRAAVRIALGAVPECAGEVDVEKIAREVRVR